MTHEDAVSGCFPTLAFQRQVSKMIGMAASGSWHVGLADLQSIAGGQGSMAKSARVIAKTCIAGGPDGAHCAGMMKDYQPINITAPWDG